MLSLGMALLIDPASAHESLARAIVVGGLANPAIIGSRLIYRSVEELVLYCRGKSETTSQAQRILLYGAGNRCQLFLKERGFHNSSSFDDRNIIGLLDDEPSLRSQWVYGYQVFGGLKDMPQIVTRHQVSGIIITAGLRPDILSALRGLAQDCNLQLSEWHFQEGELKMQDIKATMTLPAAA